MTQLMHRRWVARLSLECRSRGNVVEVKAMGGNKRSFRVFIGYGREDIGPVSEFYHALCASGTEGWMDIYALRAGEEWQLAIREALRASQLALLFLSRRTYMRSGYLQTEIHE